MLIWTGTWEVPEPSLTALQHLQQQADSWEQQQQQREDDHRTPHHPALLLLGQLCGNTRVLQGLQPQ